MNKTPRKKPAVLKISRGSTTSIQLRIQGPFPRSRKTPSSARGSTSRGPTKGKSDQASTTPRPKNNVPVYPDRPSTNCDLSRTRGSLPKAKEPLSSVGKSTNLRQTQGNLPMTKIPIFSGYGNKGSASKNPGIVHKPVNSSSTSLGLVHRTELKPIDFESSDEAFASPGADFKASETASPVSLEESEGFMGSYIPQKRVTSPRHRKTKIPISSESRTLGGSSSIQTLQANKPIVSLRTEKPQGVKSVESSSSVSRNRSYLRYPSVIQTQTPVLPTRTPTSPSILQNRRPNASESVSSVIRNRGSLSTSPSYIRRPKPSTRELEIKRTVTLISRSASKNTDPLQTKRPLPKASEPVSSVKRNRGSASTSPGRTVSSRRASVTAAPAQTPGLKANESVTSTNKDKDLASKRPGILRTRIPVTLPGPNGKQNRNTQPEGSTKQNIKSSASKSPERKSKPASKTNLALETQLADELDRRNRSILELEMKLVQNENLVSEQALRLAESKAVQRAKDVAMEQLKSELLSAKDEYNLMHLRLKEADLGLEQATCKVNKYLERSTSFEDELKEARDKIGNLQMQLKEADTKAEIHCQIKAQLHEDVERLQEQLAIDAKRIDNLKQSEKDLKEDLEKRDRVINQINQELATRDEEFRNLFETLQNRHTQLRNQELSIKRLEERYERSSLNRSKLEERNAVLMDKIERLKHNLRYYSQMIIANDGKPFYEEVPTGINPHIDVGLDPSPEEEQQQNRKPNHREK